MDYNNIILKINNKVSYITINRPHQLNALNSETIKELNHAITHSEENKNVRCVLLTGSGTKAFVAGRTFIGPLTIVGSGYFLDYQRIASVRRDNIIGRAKR